MHKPARMNVLLSVTLTFPDPPGPSEDVGEKHPQHSRRPFSVQGRFDISVTGVFIAQQRAVLSPPFLQRQPIPAQTLLAALLTHWKSHHVSTLAADSMLC